MHGLTSTIMLKSMHIKRVCWVLIGYILCAGSSLSCLGPFLHLKLFMAARTLWTIVVLLKERWRVITLELFCFTQQPKLWWRVLLWCHFTTGHRSRYSDKASCRGNMADSKQCKGKVNEINNKLTSGVIIIASNPFSRKVITISRNSKFEFSGKSQSWMQTIRTSSRTFCRRWINFDYQHAVLQPVNMCYNTAFPFHNYYINNYVFMYPGKS